MFRALKKHKKHVFEYLRKTEKIERKKSKDLRNQETFGVAKKGTKHIKQLFL
jgi:hypothetical protein